MILILTHFLTSGMAQENTSSGLFCDSIISIMRGSASDSLRISANETYIRMLSEKLNDPAALSYSFDTLTNLSVRTSNDNKVRLYTWLLSLENGQKNLYYGYLHYSDKKGNVKLYPLKDSTLTISKPESEKLRPDRWYGAIYYSIVPVKRSGKVFYTLLGWKSIDRSRTQKVIEILYFDNGIPKMGYPLLKTGKIFRNRQVYSFQANLSMVLRYEPGKKMIVVDHLTSGDGNGGPDGTYDAFKFRSGKWLLYNDVDIRSDWKPSKNVPRPFGEE